MSAAKLEKEVNTERTRDVPDTSVEAKASASKLDKLPCLEESAVTNLDKEEVTLPEHTMEAREKLACPEESALKVEAMEAAANLDNPDPLAALNDKVDALYIDNQMLKTDLRKVPKMVAELNNEIQTLHRDQDILKININKVEEEVSLLFNQNRALEEATERLHSLLEREQKHRSERKDSASNTTKNRDRIFEHTLDDHSVVDILTLSTERDQQHDQLSSEGQEPTELDPKDKGLFNFLKAVCNVACIDTNAFNVVLCVLAYNSSGRHATSEVQKLVLAVGGVCFMPFSIITARMVHGLEGKAKDIDYATGCVFAEISYAFFAICLVAMFVAKAAWFVVMPLFLVIWPLTMSWLVSRYRRPRGLYRRLRSVKMRFKYKAQKEFSCF